MPECHVPWTGMWQCMSCPLELSEKIEQGVFATDKSYGYKSWSIKLKSFSGAAMLVLSNSSAETSSLVFIGFS